MHESFAALAGSYLGMTPYAPKRWRTIVGAAALWLAPTWVLAQQPPAAPDGETGSTTTRAEGDGASSSAAPPCPCATTPDAQEAESAADGPFEPSYILALAAIPRVDGWDDTHGHRSGWGVAAGVDLSPWEGDTEVHVELTYLSNREDRLFSGDLGLKVPFHSGHRWDVHAVVGPSVAFDWQSETLDNGEKETHRAFVVGVIGGLGVAYWFQRHLGATLDVNYRVIGGEGIQHRLFTSLGMAARW